MKFAHLADCHIGSWRDPKLKDISTEAFCRAIDICIEKNVDFILIAGDLFNNPLPAMDSLKKTVEKLKQLNDLNISIYFIAGSHDYSPSGKTMLDVLESAGLAINVMKGTVEEGKLKLKFTIDQKTGAKITGVLGKRMGLEKTYYEHLLREHLEQEPGYKIFMFHTGIDEIKSKAMEKVLSNPISLLPRNFNYYAGGHVHEVSVNKVEGYGTIVYPGPLFPNSFKEIEDLQGGGFFIVEDNIPTFQPIQVYNIISLTIDVHHQTPQEVESAIYEKIKAHEFNNTIVTLRVTGTLSSGKPADINFKDIFATLYGKSAYFVMKNTAALTSPEFEEIKMAPSSVEDIEDALIGEHLGQYSKDPNERKLVKDLLDALNDSKAEGERVPDFEERIKQRAKKILNLE